MAAAAGAVVAGCWAAAAAAIVTRLCTQQCTILGSAAQLSLAVAAENRTI
jgi:hypothetical protein